MNNTFQLPLHQSPNIFIYIVGRTDMKCNSKLRNTRIHAIQNGGEIANMQAGHVSSRVRLNPFLEGSSTGQFPWTSYHLPRVVNTLWGWFSLSSLFPLPTGTRTPLASQRLARTSASLRPDVQSCHIYQCHCSPVTLSREKGTYKQIPAKGLATERVVFLPSPTGHKLLGVGAEQRVRG